ncbi:MAG: hypothetical protein QOF78_4078, partial [Phycisphaerales bacterium]|nr:hypothetical protein [Phycisphaerales bacterium]
MREYTHLGQDAQATVRTERKPGDERPRDGFHKKKPLRKAPLAAAGCMRLRLIRREYTPLGQDAQATM